MPDSSGSSESYSNEIRQILDRDRARFEHSFVVTAELKFVPEFTLNSLAEAIHSHAAHEISGELHRALLGTDDFQAGFTFGLEGVLGEKSDGFVITQLSAMHSVVEDGIGDSAEIKLELVQAEAEVTVAIALVEHHLLGIDRPTLDVDAGAEHLTDK